MNGLTFTEKDGSWGIKGMNEENEEKKMYAVACKLRDYEKTGLQPDEVLRLKENAVDEIISKLEKQLAQLQEENKKEDDVYTNLNIMQKIGKIDTAINVIREYGNVDS